MRVNLEARAAAAEQRKAQTRERLIEAAIAVIGEKGPDACSIEDFVAAAGVSRGTFYNYFPTAESLLQAVRVKIVAALTTVLDKRLPRTMPACERLATRLHSYLAAVTHDAAWSWMMLRLDGSRLERAPALEANLDEMYRAGVAQGRLDLVMEDQWQACDAEHQQEHGRGEPRPFVDQCPDPDVGWLHPEPLTCMAVHFAHPAGRRAAARKRGRFRQ